MVRIVILLSALILAALSAGCGGPSATAPTSAPQAAPTNAQSAAPTTAPTKPAAQPTAPAAVATKAPAAAATTAPAPGGATPFKLTLTIYDMQPPEMIVKVGSKIHFVITNTDTEEHDLVSAGAKLRSILVPGNKTVEVDWTAPETPGTFEAICTIHREIKPLVIKVEK
ncbi:MAG: cupredoxin domain-containing protein [Chloroflexi bacterium]|nr:cupredoxin domain-containing protein [Chloroflexota bacterium]